MNKLTNEEIAKVFAMYLGNPAVDIKERNQTISRIWNIDLDDDFADIRLLLTPLDQITDEHAIEMAKGFGGVTGKVILNRPSDLNNDDIHFTVQVYTNEPKYKSYCTPKYIGEGYNINAYLWLISKGYAVPLWFGIDHWANGKTAIELGLAKQN